MQTLRFWAPLASPFIFRSQEIKRWGSFGLRGKGQEGGEPEEAVEGTCWGNKGHEFWFSLAANGPLFKQLSVVL